MKTVYRCMDDSEVIKLITMHRVHRNGQGPVSFQEGTEEEALEELKRAKHKYVLVGTPKEGCLTETDQEGKRVTIGYSLSDFQGFAICKMRDGKTHVSVVRNFTIFNHIKEETE